MYGLVFEIVEEWVIEKQGLDVWHAIKKKAGCEVEDQSFLRRSYYPDEDLVVIIVAASELLGIAVPDILEAFGHYVIRHHFDNGYDDLLQCQGSTLRQWLSNLNAMHDHVQKTFPGEQFSAPIFWCEDCDTVPGSILLHYYSLRGTLLVPMVVGIVEELALFHFEVEVKMTQLALQDDDNQSPFTSWRITAVDAAEAWKLSPIRLDDASGDFEEDVLNNFHMELPSKCPFTGKDLKPKVGKDDDDEKKGDVSGEDDDKSLDDDNLFLDKATEEAQKQERRRSHHSSLVSQAHGGVGLTLRKMQEVFPFHVLVNRDFQILQVGMSLPSLLDKTSPAEFVGKPIYDFLEITRPVLGSSWEWKTLSKLADQHFFMAPKLNGSGKNHTLHRKVSMLDSYVKFKVAMITVTAQTVMFVLAPDARNVVDLNNMGLTMSDLPLVSCQRDTVFLGEYITQEVDKAHKLDKLSKKLQSEKNLSNTLLYNMLPKQVADDLRAGNTIEPKLYENVTLFFSDIEGFTSICDQVHPWDVIDMLNQLYGVMDHLATKFQLYKVETIGDAYMCCSGLPEPDEYHAENIANFALAVMECVQHIKSPVDHKTPLRLRIGIHTGSCTSGVVGTLTPHYCLFGDMVNTTARHESTGMAGKIQVSSVLFGRLKHFSMYGEDQPQYNFTPRGLVEMKGKGRCYTYWLDSGTEYNTSVGPKQMNELSEEIATLLQTKKFTRRRYFRRNGDIRDETMSETGTHSTFTSEYSNGLENDALCKRDEYPTRQQQLHRRSIMSNNGHPNDDGSFGVASPPPPPRRSFRQSIVSNAGHDANDDGYLGEAATPTPPPRHTMRQSSVSNITIGRATAAATAAAAATGNLAADGEDGDAVRDSVQTDIVSHVASEKVPRVNENMNGDLPTDVDEEEESTLREDESDRKEKNQQEVDRYAYARSHDSRIRSNDEEESLFGITEQERLDLDEMIAEHERIHGKPSTWEGDSDLETPNSTEQDPAATTTKQGEKAKEDVVVVPWSEFSRGDGGELSPTTNEELTTKIHAILSSLLKQALQDSDVPNMEIILCQLYGYIHHVSSVYGKDNLVYHNFRHACHVAQTANYLWEQAQRCQSNGSSKMGDIHWKAWDHFTLIFSCLVHCLRHNGSTNDQLEEDNHAIFQMHGNGRKSCLQRQSIHFAMSTLADEFPELYEEIALSYPKFVPLTRKLILATDLTSKETSTKRIKMFEKAATNLDSGERNVQARTEVIMEQIIGMSVIAHYAEDYDVVKSRDYAQFQERSSSAASSKNRKSSRYLRQTWHANQVSYIQQVVLPLAERMQVIIPDAKCNLKDCVQRNLELWQANAPTMEVSSVGVLRQHSVGSMQSLSVATTAGATVDTVLGHTMMYNKKLVKVMVQMLTGLLKRVVVSHDQASALRQHGMHQAGKIPVDEVQMVIPMKRVVNTGAIDRIAKSMELSPIVRDEIEHFVASIASGYLKNDFHNFEHATNVAALASLLLRKIEQVDETQDDEVDSSFGIKSDPLVHFAVVFAAMVHDVGHHGIPNNILAKENPAVAEQYFNKSIAEQRSVDTAWNLLMNDRYRNFRRCIYDNPGEHHRFRQLFVNTVMATDIFDKDLERMRDSRWEASFGNLATTQDDDDDKINYKATSTIEQIIQASDIGHTMQQWQVYVKWNERLFLEMYAAYVSGRSDKDPSDGWYQGELWFFDNKVIPLANKLQACGVFGESGGEYLTYAKQNRREWEKRGERAFKKMLEKAKKKYPTRG